MVLIYQVFPFMIDPVKFVLGYLGGRGNFYAISVFMNDNV